MAAGIPLADFAHDPFLGGSMESKAKFLGHPVHQMLVVFPLGLLATAVVFDVVYLIGGEPVMAAVAYWMMAAGLLGALVAAPFGLIDWLAIAPNTRAKKIGKLHGLGNGLVSLMFLGSWLIRAGNEAHEANALAYLLSFAAAGIALVTAWLGGELVSRLGVGVHEGANLDAPSSLDDRHGVHEPQHRHVH
jgi:uncharacterized membrane protein